MRSSNSSQVTHGSQTMRTPVAWYHRDVHLSRPTSRQHTPQYAQHHQLQQQHHHPVPGMNQRTSSPSLTTTSSDDREEVPIVRHPLKRQSRQSHNHTVDRRSVISKISRTPNGHQVFPSNAMNADPGFAFATQAPQPMNVYRTGTLRSSRSVPGFMMSAVNTWDGEPCPVHGSGPHSPIHGIPMSPLPVPQPVNMKRFSSVADVRSISGGNNNFFPMMTIIPPMPGDGKHIGNQLVPTAQRPFFVPAFSEQMPVRENFKVSSPIPSIHPPVIASKMKHMESYPNEDVCCKGHLIVLWIILGVVTIGVISGIILGVTVN